MKIHSRQSGFSLVEVLVAVTILLMVVTGPMTIVSRANNSTAFATEQATAFFLAQEGLELAQKGRDDLLLQYWQRQITGSGGITDPMTRFTDTTSGGLYAACFTGSCGLTASTTNVNITVKNCASTGGCLLYQDTSSSVRSLYVHILTASPSGTQTATPFTRTITMQRINESSGRVREIKVTSTVTWRTGSLVAGQKVELITYLANVYDTI